MAFPGGARASSSSSFPPLYMFVNVRSVSVASCTLWSGSGCEVPNPSSKALRDYLALFCKLIFFLQRQPKHCNDFLPQRINEAWGKMFNRKTLSRTENLELWVEKLLMNIKTKSVMFLCEGFCQSAHVLCWEGFMPVSSWILLTYSHRETEMIGLKQGRGVCDRVTAEKPGVSQGPWVYTTEKIF